MAKRKELKKKETWFIIEKIPDINFVMPYSIFIGYGKQLKKQGAGDSLKQLLWITRNGVAYLCYVRSEFDQAVQYIVSKAIKSPDWLEKNNKEIELFADQYLAFTKSVLKINLINLSDKQLINKLNRTFYFQIRSHSSGQATNWLIDADNQLFSKYLFDYLKKIIKERKLKLDLAATFSLITTPLKPSFVEIENQESLKLAFQIAQDKVASNIFKRTSLDKLEKELRTKKPKLLTKLKNHQKKWFWLHYNYRGPVLELDYFLQVGQGLVKEGKIKKYLKESEIKFNKLRNKQNLLFKKLNFDPKHKKLFNQAQYIVWLKSYRKDCMYFGAYTINQIVKEIANRLFISFNQAEFMTQPEFSQALIKKKFNLKELNQRFKFSVIHGTWNEVRVYSGQSAKDFSKKLKWEKQKQGKVDKLTGQIASPGKVKGIVKIIEVVADISKMKQGNIMLSETTYPALVPAMKKAAAIVTNIGGLTCHAAIISRELKIPCVVGTKIATKVLKDGDKVEVDANKGIIKKI